MFISISHENSCRIAKIVIKGCCVSGWRTSDFFDCVSNHIVQVELSLSGPLNLYKRGFTIHYLGQQHKMESQTNLTAISDNADAGVVSE